MCDRCSVNVIYSTSISVCITGNIEFIISASTTISYLPTCAPRTFFCCGLPALGMAWCLLGGNCGFSPSLLRHLINHTALSAPPPAFSFSCPCLSFLMNSDHCGLRPLSLTHSVSTSGVPLGTVPPISFVCRVIIKKSKAPDKYGPVRLCCVPFHCSHSSLDKGQPCWQGTLGVPCPLSPGNAMLSIK